MNLSLYKKYLEAEQYLQSLGNLTSVNFFKGTSNPDHHFNRMKHLLKLAGNPDKNFKIIHVAGTSGKGTTTQLMANILQTAGYKTGTHYSPHVSVATERIQINNKLISVTDFIKLVDQAKPILKKCYQTYNAPSFFEAWLLITLMYFKKQKIDYAVLETGCGGRYDGTNAVTKTEAQLITNISFDHTHILGNTLQKIAFEKGGIIRKNGKCFTTATQPVVLNMFRKICKKENSDLTIINNNFKESKTNKTSSINESLVTEVAHYLKIPGEAIKKGLKQTKLPARFEIIKRKNKPTIIIDGAHNEEKINFLTLNLKDLLKPKKNKPKIHLVCALTDNKKPEKVFKNLIPEVNYLYCTRFLNSFRKTTPPLNLQKSLLKINKKTSQIFLDPQIALKVALKKAKPQDIILITGSFFLCGDLRKNWYPEEKILESQNLFVK